MTVGLGTGPARGGGAGRQTTSGRGSRGFWPMRDLPVLGWLLAALVVGLFHPFLPAPRWLLVHLTLLGAVTHSIFVWSRYFADTLLRSAPDPTRGPQNRRLALLDLGVLAVLAGVVGDWWPVTVAGASAVLLAVVLHLAALVRGLRGALAPRFRIVVRFYVAAASLFPVGIVLGALVARVQADPWHTRLVVAHACVNLLGWIGLTVAGTLVTLWPTMLRTRLADGVERSARRALPVLLLAIAVVLAGALAGVPLLAAVGLAGYLAGLLLMAPGFVDAARRRAPTSFPAASALGAVTWLVACLSFLVVAFATASDWAVVGDRFGAVIPYLAGGFAAQVLLGAMSYLIPVALGGGPCAVAAATGRLDSAGLFRATVFNASLVACTLPVPAAVRVACSALALLVLASFLPLLVLAVRDSLRVRRSPTPTPTPANRDRLVEKSAGNDKPVPISGEARRGIAVGLVVVLLAVVGGLALDERLAPDGAAIWAGVAATGETTTVQVEAVGMRFVPDTIEVPVGNRLVIELTNADEEDVHDLVLDDGTESGRLSPGESATVEVPVVGRDVEAWCSVIGHRQMGMTLHIDAIGADDAGPAGHGAHAASPHHAHGDSPANSPQNASGAAGLVDLYAAPADGFTARDATLPPLPPDTGSRLHRHTFRVQEVLTEVAPGVRQTLWTYNGTAPGPVLHGRVGDRFEITLVNDASIGHSIDFHAGALAPDEPMRTLPPGERLVYRFTATRAGIWMYHCSSMPMSAHIANGMFGAVVIEPADLPEVDRSYLLVQSELYLGEQDGPVDAAKVAVEEPDLVVFNGHATQYDHQPLRARVGERVRIWLLDAGPNRPAAFHVVGGQFATAYAEGAYLLRPPTDGSDPGGSQTLALAASQGGFVEMEFPEAGHYPFTSHIMVDAERGAHGVFEVTGPKGS